MMKLLFYLSLVVVTLAVAVSEEPKAQAALTPKAAAAASEGPPSAEKILNQVKDIEKQYKAPDAPAEVSPQAQATEIDPELQANHQKSVQALADAQKFKDALLKTAKKHVMEMKGIKPVDAAAEAQAKAAAEAAEKAKREGAPTSLLDVTPTTAAGLQQLSNTNSAAAQKAADQHPAILKLASDTAPMPTHCADKDPTDATHTLVNNSPKAVVLNTGMETTALEKEIQPPNSGGLTPNEMAYKSVSTDAKLNTDPRVAFKTRNAMTEMDKNRIVQKVIVKQLCEDGSCPPKEKEE